MKKGELGKKLAVCIALLMLASATLGFPLTRTYFIYGFGMEHDR
jgi:hypothetical protein